MSGVIPSLHCLDDPPPRDLAAPSLGWDTLIVDHGGMFGGRRRHAPIDRQPVSLPFMMGQRDLNNFSGMFEAIFILISKARQIVPPSHYHVIKTALS